MIDGTKLYLWRNGDHYLAFDNTHPCYPNGDPKTLGEPAATAIFKESRSRWNCLKEGGSKKSKIDPCAHCTKEGWLVERTYKDGHAASHRVECISCGMRTGQEPSEERAVKIWNQRAPNIEAQVVREILHSTLDVVKECDEKENK